MPAKKRPPRTDLVKPTVLTAEVQRRIIEAIVGGDPLQTAVRRSGISYEGFYYWRCRLKEGHKDALIYTDFFKAVNLAQNEAEHLILRQLLESAYGWQRFAWVLERRYNNHWGKQVTINLKGVKSLAELSDAELEEAKRQADRAN